MSVCLRRAVSRTQVVYRLLSGHYLRVQADAELTFPEGGSAKDDVQGQYNRKPEIKVAAALALFVS